MRLLLDRCFPFEVRDEPDSNEGCFENYPPNDMAAQSEAGAHPPLDK